MVPREPPDHQGRPGLRLRRLLPALRHRQPCPQDTTVLLLTRRALDYGTVKRTGEPISLFSHKAKNDLWDPGRAREMDTWPSQGMHDMAAHMMGCSSTKPTASTSAQAPDILNKAVRRSLHVHDPAWPWRSHATGRTPEQGPRHRRACRDDASPSDHRPGLPELDSRSTAATSARSPPSGRRPPQGQAAPKGLKSPPRSNCGRHLSSTRSLPATPSRHDAGCGTTRCARRCERRRER